MSAKEGWNAISKIYQQKSKISLEDVHYGPISPGESELNLLGNVIGKDVLEIGCGGGQNAIVLAKWGARSVGLDFSEEQIRHARRLAKKENVTVSFYIGSMEDLSMFQEESFDIVLSSFGIGYVKNLAKTFNEVFRVLRKNGCFVFADVHPVANRGRAIRYRSKIIWGLSNYFNRRKRLWTWRIGGKVAQFQGYHRTIQDYFDLLLAADFVAEKILEPEPYALDKMSEAEKRRIPYVYEDFVKNYDLWKRIPYTIIFKARKPR